jgi:hypothetical protein
MDDDDDGDDDGCTDAPSLPLVVIDCGSVDDGGGGGGGCGICYLSVSFYGMLYFVVNYRLSVSVRLFLLYGQRGLLLLCRSSHCAT